MEEIRIELVEWGTKEYELALDLRHRVFRVPAGLNIYDEDLSHEVSDYHICAFLGDRIVGVLKISKDQNTAYIKQVAVDEEVRGISIGRKIMMFAEEIAETIGCNTIVLDARYYAIDFYKKLGYEGIGDVFIDPMMTVGMTYLKMIKYI